MRWEGVDSILGEGETGEGAGTVQLALDSWIGIWLYKNEDRLIDKYKDRL